MLVTDRFPSPSSPPFFFPVCFFSFSWLPHFLPSASFFSLPLLPRFPATLGVVISKRKHRAEPQPPSFSIPQFPPFFYGQRCPSRPVVQEMPSNLIGLGEECARPTQNNSEKKLIRKNKNCASWMGSTTNGSLRGKKAPRPTGRGFISLFACFLRKRKEVSCVPLSFQISFYSRIVYCKHSSQSKSSNGHWYNPDECRISFVSISFARIMRRVPFILTSARYAHKKKSPTSFSCFWVFGHSVHFHIRPSIRSIGVMFNPLCRFHSQ